MSLLDIDKLTVKFGGLTAVSQVDLDVASGQIYSVIGPNGAGKTTVFNAITGIYEPTSGEIKFDGRRQERPLSGNVIAGCILVGLATGLLAALFMGNVDKLWKAAFRRNLFDPDRTFSYTQALRDGLGYLKGDLAVERRGDGTFAVTTADGTKTLTVAESRDEAVRKRDAYEWLIPYAADDVQLTVKDSVVQSGDSYALLAQGEQVTVADRFRFKERAVERLEFLAQIPGQRRAFLAWLAASFVGGTLIGIAGAAAVWRRARRTPDVIALGGLARTFQNIRLFHNMTVLENVLVGMDRKFKRHLLGTLFRLPVVRNEEKERTQDALKLLEFVGLADKRDALAKNLPYGQQRRLEIARALATSPRLLLLDEPAAGMNPTESDDLMHLVRKIRDQNITVVLIEHHMRLVMNISDRIAVLDHGEKIAEGTPAEVKANPQVIEAYLGKEEVH